VSKKANGRGVRAYHACKHIVYNVRLHGIPMPIREKVWQMIASLRWSCHWTSTLKAAMVNAKRA